MLQHLLIDNYALIDHLEIGFDDGFSAITGETGAGKSILLGALGLILGSRADTQVLSDKDRKCIVEGTFNIRSYQMKAFFTNNQLDYDEVLIMRREISPGGKSRAFVNDTPVGLTVMKELGEKLVNVHSQHEIIMVNEAEFQLAVIDSYAGITGEAAEYRHQYDIFNGLSDQLQELIEKEKSASAELDYLGFLLEELEKADIKEDEQEDLEEELTLLSHAEEVKNGLINAVSILEQSDHNVISALNESLSALKKVSGFHSKIPQNAERLASDLIDIKDITRELESLAGEVELDPTRLESCKERLDLIYHLQNKHHVGTCTELHQVKEDLRERVDSISSLEDQIGEVRTGIKELENELEIMADNLSDKRSEGLQDFQEEILQLLVSLGMPEARFEVRQEKLDKLSKDGRDSIIFYFNANRGHSPLPLSDIASGGELSRVMLSIKSMISQRNLLPTIIFDEIDNGVSGDIAGRVGDVLKKMAGTMQVLVITHLPQIAGKADRQYCVFKLIRDDITHSEIKILNDQERVEELAKMISGKDITPASVATARELLLPGQN